MTSISLFRPGSLVWLPAQAKRFRWESNLQLEIFPKDYSITKIPLIGILKGYTNRGDCEVLFRDGIWDVEAKDLSTYVDTLGQRERNDRINTNQKA
jgi:hypothetical protein